MFAEWVTRCFITKKILWVSDKVPAVVGYNSLTPTPYYSYQLITG